MATRQWQTDRSRQTDQPREVNHQSLRAARDQLIDSLGLGFTWPLTDLTLPAAALKVPYDMRAAIPVEDSQRDVVYQLHDQHGVPIENSDDPSGFYQHQGNGATLMLQTAPIEEDQSLRIWAAKSLHEQNPGKENSYAAYLDQAVVVKVGLDTALVAEIVSDTDILDSQLETVLPESARIIDFALPVTVELYNSQEGVHYQLVEVLDMGEQERVLSPVVMGLGGGQSIQLESIVLEEDVDIRIRATKHFDVALARNDETALLDILLPLKVRASAELALFVGAPSAEAADAIVAFAGSARIYIQSTQASTHYSLYQRPLSADDIVFDDDGVSSDRLLFAEVPGRAEPVKVRKPQREDIWVNPPADFLAVGSEQAGTGEPMAIAVDGVENDNVVIVRARKYHRDGDKVITSAVQLRAGAIVLVRPDDQRQLRLRFSPAQNTISLAGGQPGVFYRLRLSGTGEDISDLPAYFHQWGTAGVSDNRGIGALRVGVGLVVAADQNPQAPQLQVSELAAGAELDIYAYKAITAVAGAAPQRITFES